MHKILTTLFLAASTLAVPAPDATATGESIGIETNPDADASASASAAALVAQVPSSISMVMETAIPISWQDEVITNPTFRSSVASAAAAGTYPAWISDRPNSVKACSASGFRPGSRSISSSVAASVSSSKSIGAAPAPARNIAISVAGAAGVVALAFAL